MNTLEEIDNLKTQLALAQADLAASVERVDMLKLGIARLEGYCEALQFIRQFSADKASNPNADITQPFPKGRYS